MAAFIPGAACSFTGRTIAPRSATCAATPPTPVMAYDMNGSGPGSLSGVRIKSSGVENDRRFFKVSYVLPSESRLYTFRELQNVYTVKRIPFSSWYAEQQRIQKMGGKILKVELASGGQMRSVSTLLLSIVNLLLSPASCARVCAFVLTWRCFDDFCACFERSAILKQGMCCCCDHFRSNYTSPAVWASFINKSLFFATILCVLVST